MEQILRIVEVHAREILDSRGNPTVEAEVTVEKEPGGERITGRAAVPSGASTGRFEAVELRDGETRYFGLGTMKAVNNVNTKIREALLGINALDQGLIDRILIDQDGTENKSNLGANATLGVSMACAKVSSLALRMPLYRYLGGAHTRLLPVPMMNILNGGKHADNTVDFQEFMIMPVQAESFADGLRICAEIYHNLKQICNQKGLSTGVGDEGGFAPSLADAEEVLSLIVDSIKAAGYAPGQDIKIAMDAAASELYDETTDTYYFPGESRMRNQEIRRSASEMVAYYEKLVERFPIISIEDGLFEDDWDGWQLLTKTLGEKIQLVGDDLFVTNTERIAKGANLRVSNAVLIKPNQIGSVTETLEAIRMTKNNQWNAIVSHRSGETEDTTISDIAVGLNAGQIKTGAPTRTDRVCKYNQLLRIEEQLGESAAFMKLV